MSDADNKKRKRTLQCEEENTKIVDKINSQSGFLMMENLVKNNNNIEIIKIFDTITFEQINRMKVLGHDQKYFDISVSRNNTEIVTYFIKIKLNMGKWLLYNCVINDSKECFEILKNIAPNQHYNEYFLELCARHDSVRTMTYIFGLSNEINKRKLINIIETIRLMKSHKCSVYIKQHIMIC